MEGSSEADEETNSRSVKSSVDITLLITNMCYLFVGLNKHLQF